MKILTFDLEDWFHLLDHPGTRDPAGWSGFESRLARNTDLILEELARRSLTATFFSLGWVGQAHPNVIRRIVAAGHEIGSHSYVHTLVHQQSRPEFAAELDRSISILEEVSGRKVRAYRAPGFSITRATPWAFDTLVERGIDLDASIFPATHAHGGIEGMPGRPCVVEHAGGIIRELPMSVGRILGRDIPFSGGGYFRALPYALIRAQMQRAPYVMSYFHPRDFDVGQPILSGLSRRRRWRAYVGIGGAIGKLRRLLDEFSFVDVSTAVEAIDWSAVPRLRISETRPDRTATARKR